MYSKTILSNDVLFLDIFQCADNIKNLNNDNASKYDDIALTKKECILYVETLCKYLLYNEIHFIYKTERLRCKKKKKNSHVFICKITSPSFRISSQCNFLGF